MAVPADTTRSDVIYRALLAGFIATAVASIVLLAAYALASWLGATTPGVLGRWFTALTTNQATALVQDGVARALIVNIVVGLGWGFIYAWFVEPRLSGSGWEKGIRFALVPWILSLIVFLPLVGGGFLGLALGAGPLPIIGNLILHLVYGSTLGGIYELEVLEAQALGGQPLSVSSLANISAERGMAAGIASGGIGGAIIGAIVAALVGAGAVPIAVGLLAGAVFGAAAGAFVGSFVGLSRA